VHDRKLGLGRGREVEPESTTQSEPSGRNDREPHRMSLEKVNREPSPCRLGEGCQVPLSNSCPAVQHLGGVSEGDRTGRALRVSRESSSGEAKPQPAVQGGDPAEAARAAGAVGVPRSSDDPPESRTGGERRRGTWGNGCGPGEGPADGRTEAETLFDRITRPPKVQKLPRALSRQAKAAPGYRCYSLDGELLRRDLLATAMAAVAHPDGAPGVDGQACSAYTRGDAAWVCWRDSWLEELRPKTDRPQPVRRVWIPKGHGKTRPLGIPTVKDRVVPTAVALLRRPIWEADRHPHRYAYRPRRNAHQAMDALSQALRSGRTEVIDADLSGYFDRLPRFEISALKFEISEGPSRPCRGDPGAAQSVAARPDGGTGPGPGPSCEISNLRFEISAAAPRPAA